MGLDSVQQRILLSIAEDIKEIHDNLCGMNMKLQEIESLFNTVDKLGARTLEVVYRSDNIQERIDKVMKAYREMGL